MERLLVSGTHKKELIDYFGAAEYRDLSRLARRAATTSVEDDAPHVIVVPGIMGSQLGLVRPAPLPNDIVWVDPIDIQNLISNFYPLALRDTRPACPMYPPGDPNSTVYEKPWTLGMCRLRATEPPYPYPDAP